MFERGKTRAPAPYRARSLPAAESGSTLLPMLIGGLVLIVVGAAVVMTFV